MLPDNDWDQTRKLEITNPTLYNLLCVFLHLEIFIPDSITMCCTCSDALAIDVKFLDSALLFIGGVAPMIHKREQLEAHA